MGRDAVWLEDPVSAVMGHNAARKVWHTKERFGELRVKIDQLFVAPRGQGMFVIGLIRRCSVGKIIIISFISLVYPWFVDFFLPPPPPQRL